MIEFLTMGGYATYVWGAYGITSVVLGLNLYSAQSCYRKQLAQVVARHKEEQP